MKSAAPLTSRQRRAIRAATAEHAEEHRVELTPVILGLAVLLVVAAICAFSLDFGLVAAPARHAVFLVFAFACFSMISVSVLAWAGFQGRMLARRAFLSKLISKARAAFAARSARARELVSRAARSTREVLFSTHKFADTRKSRLVASAGGIAHACLTPRLLAQRPIHSLHARATTLLT